MALAMVPFVAHQYDPTLELRREPLDQGSVGRQMMIVLVKEPPEIPVGFEAITYRLRRAQILFMPVLYAYFFQRFAQRRFRETATSRHRQFSHVQQDIDIEQPKGPDKIFE